MGAGYWKAGIVLALILVASQPARAVTCDEFDKVLASQGVPGKEKSAAYIDGWLSAFATTTMFSNMMGFRSGSGRFYCPDNWTDDLGRDDIVQMYRNAIANDPATRELRSKDPKACHPEAVVIGELVRRHPCE